MEVTMGVTEARRRFGEVLDRVRQQDDVVILERYGKPVAVVVPFALYDQVLRHRLAPVPNQGVAEIQEQNNGSRDD